ncbi:hypothetical protein F4808DRAFT_465389 [Astrocystis sublimbata]|nr:hypothetical protein F4808DRAFT_465389 [Astrocystis sublimbata]
MKLASANASFLLPNFLQARPLPRHDHIPSRAIEAVARLVFICSQCLRKRLALIRLGFVNLAKMAVGMFITNVRARTAAAHWTRPTTMLICERKYAGYVDKTISSKMSSANSGHTTA